MKRIHRFRKADLMKLPSKGWLMSNTGTIDGMYFHPSVEVELSAPSDTSAKNQLWASIRNRVAGRIVYHCENDEDYWTLKCQWRS